MSKRLPFLSRLLMAIALLGGRPAHGQGESHAATRPITVANAFEISNIHEERNASRSYQSDPEYNAMLHCYISSKTCHRINSPETGCPSLDQNPGSGQCQPTK